MIQIEEKPESVSWDEISRVVYQAYSLNRKKGVDIRNAHLTGEEMKQSLGLDGQCFVAIDSSRGGDCLLLCKL